MCLLILLMGVDPDYPVIVANNRDESRSRKAAPPGLFVGARHRILSPRDRVGGGTWLGVNDRGMLAGITNVAGVAERELPTTRGELPHLALDQDDIDAAVAAVQARCAAAEFNPFQLLITDGGTAIVLAHEGGVIEATRATGPTAVLTNYHRLDALHPPGLAAAAAPGLELDERLRRLGAILLDTGADGGHPILKRGGAYGTVASSLVAVGAARSGLVWRYAPGPPDSVDYRNYGNLWRRLRSG